LKFFCLVTRVAATLAPLFLALAAGFAGAIFFSAISVPPLVGFLTAILHPVPAGVCVIRHWNPCVLRHPLDVTHVTLVIRYAFELARREGRSLTSVSKANALQYSAVLWDDVFDELAGEYPDVETHRLLVLSSPSSP
jgi:uncharacterized membrane protein